MKKKGLKILLVCIINRNYGDTIIADCTDYLIRRALGRDSGSSILRYKIDCGDLWQIQFADAVVFAGGGLVKFRQEKFYPHVCDIISEAEKHGIPVFMNAVGVEGFDDSDERCTMLRDALNSPCVKGVTVRDDLKLLKEKYVQRKDLRVKGVFDPAVWAGRLYGYKNGDEEVIGLNVARGELFPDYGREDMGEEFMLDLWADVAKRLDEKGLECRVFTNGALADEAFADKLMARLDRGEKLPAPMGAKQLVRNISDFSAMIATRMHACITAYSLGIPCVGLVWNDKLSFWGKKTGRPERFISADDISAENLVDALMRAIKKGAPHVSEMKCRSVYKELERFLEKYADNRNITCKTPDKGQLFEVGLGGIQHRYKAPNSPDELSNRLEEGCLLFEADVRASEDGTPVCINGWTEKNLKLLGLSAKDYPRKELPAQILRQSRLDGAFTMGSFEETAGLIAGYQGAKVIIDVGLPPADLKAKMFADIAEILKKTGLSKKRSYIRLQREGDIKLWKKQKCPCELMYFLPDSDIPEERAEKQAKALEICEKYSITLISMLSKTFDDSTAEMLKSKGMKPVIFAYDKLGDAFNALDKGAEMVGTNFYSARYAEKLTGKTQK